jgi:hypothetical protein
VEQEPTDELLGDECHPSAQERGAAAYPAPEW